jgi:hypothetical protein
MLYMSDSVAFHVMSAVHFYACGVLTISSSQVYVGDGSAQIVFDCGKSKDAHDMICAVCCNLCRLSSRVGRLSTSGTKLLSLYCTDKAIRQHGAHFQRQERHLLQAR